MLKFFLVVSAILAKDLPRFCTMGAERVQARGWWVGGWYVCVYVRERERNHRAKGGMLRSKGE